MVFLFQEVHLEVLYMSLGSKFSFKVCVPVYVLCLWHGVCVVYLWFESVWCVLCDVCVGWCVRVLCAMWCIQVECVWYLWWGVACGVSGFDVSVCYVGVCVVCLSVCGVSMCCVFVCGVSGRYGVLCVWLCCVSGCVCCVRYVCVCVGGVLVVWCVHVWCGGGGGVSVFGVVVVICPCLVVVVVVCPCLVWCGVVCPGYKSNPSSAW